ncbi:LysR family transcriptional regulator [Aureimonas populi]|uniref:LysR family transcriptional regulator n=1 Tax=Aureimonas populi TaxID=1701758 RepID=A0ABW5CMG0_9HYPH|nr:LysR family transcriptional regulator [Aureimonas populi]
MQLRALLYFQELVRLGSMRRVAEKFGVAPTAVSRQIDQLEYHFDAPLVERDPRGVRLTAAGELLAVRLTRALADLQHAETLIADLKGLRSGNVSIYTNGAAVPAILTKALVGFARLYPKIRFEIVVTSVGLALEAVRNGSADIALTLFTPAAFQHAVHYRFPVPHAIVVNPRHRLAERGEARLADLADCALALPDSSFGARQSLDRQMAEAGLPPLDPVYTTSSMETQKDLAREASAVLFLPPMAVRRECEAGELVAVPLVDATVTTTLDLSHAPERPLSFAAAKLLAAIERDMRTSGSARV